MNKLRFIIFFLASVLIGGMYFISRPFAAIAPKVVAEKKFSDDNLVAIKVDSFKQLVRQVYGANATVTDGRNKIETIISKQGTRYAYFYNNNDRLLKVTDQGFTITYNTTNDVLESSFKKDTKDGIAYVYLPGDVVMGIVQQKQ
jgi:hypothetical protein